MIGYEWRLPSQRPRRPSAVQAVSELLAADASSSSQVASSDLAASKRRIARASSLSFG